ncbi:fungal-specific transcription factor domain-containing protein [Phascolomyces articulosus]|uniref:Fungal-specific transcription factor domain-containing protein n=1 Tax=Phascolomyces articulosus TaxID=60185 RepID=A0AAD5JW56_9FUNG|nr:fungal-specific transcription factor domain-containing protein [Phascolomyces articulosus]
MNVPFESKTSHQSSTSGSNKKDNKSKRSRTARACDFCRRKKSKCYGAPGEPCSSCISYGVACEFTDGSKKRGPPKGSRYVDTLEKRIRKIESTLLNCGHYSVPTAPVAPAASTTASTLPSTAARSSISPKEKGRRFIPYPKNKQERGDTLDSVRFMGDLPELEIFRKHIIPRDIYEVGGQHFRKVGKHFVEMVSPTNDPLEKRRFRGPPIPKTVTGINHWIYSMSGVDRYTSDRLMKIYFMNVHPLLPVINKGEFLRQYRDQADTYPSAELLNAMFGAAARFIEIESRKQESSNAYPELHCCEAPENWHIRFFEQAHAIATINPPRSSVSTVQTTVIIYNTSGNVSSSESEGWLMSGAAIRLAQFFAINRDCDGWDIPEQEKETRKRVWWSLYISDRFQAANVGRPLSIYDEDNDVGYPDPSESWAEVLDDPTDEDDDAWPRFPSATFRPESTEGRVEIYQLFIQLIKLSEILGHILQALYTPRARKISLKYGWNQIVTRLDHELTEWRFGFPTALERIKYKDFDEITGYFAPTIASFLLSYFGCLILLHRPFIERDTNNNDRPSYSSFRISTSAATRGIRIAERMSIRDYLMLPYCFNITPILQFSLIHIYNSRSPDGRIAAPSKAYFHKTMELVTKIQPMSKRATQLYKVLKFIIDTMNIPMESEAGSPTNDEAATAVETITPPSTTANNTTEPVPTTVDKEQNIQQEEKTWVESGIPRKISDVGRGVSPLQQPSPRSMNTNVATPTTSSSSSTTVAAAAAIATTATATVTPPIVPNFIEHQTNNDLDLQSWDTGWDGGSYLPVSAPPLAANTTSNSTYQPPSNGSEAYTIRQFGYDTQTCSPGELESILRNISTSSFPLPGTVDQSTTDTAKPQTLPTQISPSTATTTSVLSYNGLENTQSQPTTTAPISSFSPPLQNVITTLSPQQPIPTSSTPHQQNLQNTFHSDPSNPFSSVPVSLDMGEWGEWMQQQFSNNTANPSTY